MRETELKILKQVSPVIYTVDGASDAKAEPASLATDVSLIETQLPNELWFHGILLGLLPEDIWNLAQVNTFFSLLLKDNVFWMNKAKKYFPELFNSCKNPADIEWYSVFHEAYNRSMHKLSAEQRRLFSQAKEGLLSMTDLEARGFDTLELKDSEGRTLHSWIAFAVAQALLDSLFTALKNVNFKSSETDQYKRTLLHWAVQSNQSLSSVSDLAATIDVKAVDKSGDTALAMAAKYGFLGHAKLLWDLEQAKGGITNSNRLLPLAILNAHISLVEFFLEQGILPNEKSDLGYSPLYLAASRGNVPIVKLLLEHKVAVNEPSTTIQMSALAVAVQNGHCEVVKLLLENGANVDSKDKRGVTALFIAVSKSNYHMVQLLLEHGASLDMTAGNTKTTVFSQAERLKDNGLILALLRNEQNKRLGSQSCCAAATAGFFATKSLTKAEDGELDTAEYCGVRNR
ncbi:ankyrin repeat protein [Legionella massiliensis]|uniref:Ankyrin repeat protein n=1 Tax=Legionella massiliensis TaxID=1034943 RepID=A0A078KU41_9GAMM|nr:ankyrin repeat domain-containing protein [Legionella massiliensis]CDZ77945.1 ankyrin repeat protein [Legionella massiliensis]CEE13683.1 Ankyrin repeats (3 copies) [Legionella massiliensis]